MLALLLTATIQNPKFVDSDLDGLYDHWETDGFGPITPAEPDCKPGRSDVFIVFRMRSTMTQAKIQATIDRVRRFYAELPYTNPDGSKGLNMIPIVPPVMPKDTDGKDYKQLYNQGMPEEWRGLAHGILVDDSPGGGGQCNRPDWCGTGYNWMTMVHEVGHQFGLPHDPMGARTGSPFHPSLMNYDYSYQLGGKGEAIQYSHGKFVKLRMKETDLNEVVPFPLPDVQFLTSRPYYFKA
ncbi:MAG: M12 family metallo-peptidase, partial [Fimbriimonadaceae bacterium]